MDVVIVKLSTTNQRASFCIPNEMLSYDWSNCALCRSQIGVGRTLLAGGTAGVCNWLVAIPADVVKSRLQSAPEGTYSGIEKHNFIFLFGKY